MTQPIISIEEIKETQFYKGLKENCLKNLIIRLQNRKQISYGLAVFNNTKVIPGSISGNNLRVLKEILKNEQQNES